jgi:hypothetical protein
MRHLNIQIAGIGGYSVGVFLTTLTVLAGAVLGGGIAVNVTAVVIIAAIALVLLAVANGVRMLSELSDSMS